MAKLYPIGMQNFESLRKENFLYIDKTALIYQLVQTGKYYFLSRPRRFGKSLLLSTLEAYLQGKKELFKDLAIDKLEKDWTSYPILHLDLNTEKYDTSESLERILDNTLSAWEKQYGTEPTETSFPLRFKGIIQRAAEQTGKPVAILIDEYDKPMLQTIDNETLQEDFRNSLKAFYSVLKTMDKNIYFALLTGVTKFGKITVFSDLNNLEDISMNWRYDTLCGITEEEIHQYLEPELHELADANQMTYTQACHALKEQYDGYRFTSESIGVYNPFSLLNTFKSMRFNDYWFETGTPSFLVKLLQKSHYDLQRLSHEVASSDALNSIDSVLRDPIPVLYQSGYLTICDYNQRFDVYYLGFPNKEVEAGFMRYLLPFYASIEESKSTFHIMKFVQEIEAGDYDGFLRRLQSFFADTPYELVRDLELHYQNVLFIVYKLLGFYVKAEYHTSEGRIDLVLEAAQYIYIMEFKFGGTAEEALIQIQKKGYALPFATDSRKLILLGINFNPNTRNIDQWMTIM